MNTSDFRSKYHHIPVAREGIPYLVAAMFVTLIMAILGWSLLTLPLLAITLLIGHFFRDPERMSNAQGADVVSPADGNVIAIRREESNRLSDKPCMKISIFMSVFDVHVNRVPFSGTVSAIHYQKGRFLAANFAKASYENEQSWLAIKTDSGAEIVLSQVAGLIARRIVCWPRPGDSVVRGERFGLIRFGSRLDVYVPEDAEILVNQATHVYAGETVLCRLR